MGKSLVSCFLRHSVYPSLFISRRHYVPIIISAIAFSIQQQQQQQMRRLNRQMLMLTAAAYNATALCLLTLPAEVHETVGCPSVCLSHQLATSAACGVFRVE